MPLTSKLKQAKDENLAATVISLTPRQEEIYFWLRGKIDPASVGALSRLVNRALRDAENESAFIVAGMKKLAEEHKAGVE